MISPEVEARRSKVALAFTNIIMDEKIVGDCTTEDMYVVLASIVSAAIVSGMTTKSRWREDAERIHGTVLKMLDEPSVEVFLPPDGKGH